MLDDIRAKLEFAESNTDLFEPIKVLDKGFVRLVDWFGTDARIVQAARVSYQGGTKIIRSDEGLIDYLIRHNHSSPIEMCNVLYHIKLPIFVFAQISRHRVSNVNASSARYSIMKDEFYIPTTARTQSKNNKQGSEAFSLSEQAIADAHITEATLNISLEAYQAYEDLLEGGIAREMARVVLPQNLYTEIYWKQDLRNLLHLLNLRLDDHAQWETRQYAEAMASIAARLFPYTWKSWENHTRNAVRLSSQEAEILGAFIGEHLTDIEQAVDDLEISAGAKREMKEKFRAL